MKKSAVADELMVEITDSLLKFRRNDLILLIRSFLRNFSNDIVTDATISTLLRS
ncbi:MAG: hypothetical protein QM610_01245 [Chitinophagaceae bacterium]